MSGFLIVRTDHLLAAQGDFVMALQRSGLPFHWPPATGPLGRYPDRTSTGKSTAALQDTHYEQVRQRASPPVLSPLQFLLLGVLPLAATPFVASVPRRHLHTFRTSASSGLMLPVRRTPPGQ